MADEVKTIRIDPVVEAEPVPEKEPTKKQKTTTTDLKFNKEQLKKSKRYADAVDIVSAILLDGKEYTLDEVDALIQEFNKKEIKTC